MELLFCLSLFVMLANAAEVDIAPGKPVSQSTTYSTMAPERGIDGAYNTYARTGSGDPSPYWQIDLQGAYDISSVSITIAFETHYMSGVKIWLYDREPGSISQNVVCATFPGYASLVKDTVYDYNCSASFPVRYLRLTRGGTTMCFREIKIFATEYDTTPVPVSRYEGQNEVTLTNVLQTMSVTSVNECGMACHSEPSCAAFSVTMTTSTDNCIQSTNHQTSVSENWRVYLKQPKDSTGLDTCTFGV